MVERDRQRVLVEAPQRLEHVLRLQARVDEDEGRAVLPDEVVDRRHGQGRRYGRRAAGGASIVEHADVGRARRPRRRRGRRALVRPRLPLRHQVAAQVVRLAHRRREADRRELRRERVEPREAEAQEVAALRGDEGVQFVEHHPRAAPRRAPAPPRWARSSASCSGVVSRMSGGRSIWRGALVGGGVAGAGLDPDRQAHLARPASRGCARCRPRAPSGARRRGCAGAPLARRGPRSASSTRLGRKPARVLPAPVGATSRTERPARALARRSSWCGRGAQPRLSNQRRKRSGRGDAESTGQT